MYLRVSGANFLTEFEDQFPLSAKYDPAWVLDNMMGPNALWLAEALTQKIELRPGMRVLDLGCGKAMTSIFLAKEFDVEVWATDLWISATENKARIDQAHLSDQVFPIHADARNLPFANQFFDCVVSFDAFHYFGTDDLYLGDHLAKLIKPGGDIGIVVPGLVEDFDKVPDHLGPYWEKGFNSFHSAEWWTRHWRASGVVSDVDADIIPEGWRQWAAFQRAWLAHALNSPRADGGRSELEMIELDAGRNLGFVRMRAKKR
jgi:SAM-dependent methyltransferase